MAAIIRLSLTNFRNHGDALVEGGPGFVLLSGPNGAGKTNILEAVSLLAPGRGLRQVPISEMAQSGGPGGFSVAARLEDATEIGTGTTAAAPERRQVRINGAATAVNSLGERLAEDFGARPAEGFLRLLVPTDDFAVRVFYRCAAVFNRDFPAGF